MAKLVVSKDGKIVNQYFIDKTNITIGRETSNDLVIDDAAISAQQLTIKTVGKDAIIEDPHNSQSVRINGKPLSRQILLHRDVIDLGRHQLRFMSTDPVAANDLDRTMLIQTLAPESGQVHEATAPSQATKAKLMPGHIEVMAGDFELMGKLLPLSRVVTTFGIAGERLLVLTRRPRGVFVTHVEGAKPPQVNRQSIGKTPYELKAGDIIDGAGYRLKFLP